MARRSYSPSSRDLLRHCYRHPPSRIRAAPLKILIKRACGSDDPTKAAFPFSHGLALAEAGHQVQIYLLGEAVVLMRRWRKPSGKMAQQKIRLGRSQRPRPQQ